MQVYLCLERCNLVINHIDLQSCKQVEVDKLGSYYWYRTELFQDKKTEAL